jgi:hypothetical protein
MNPSNIGWNQVNKAVTKGTIKAIKTADDIVMPHSALDVAIMATPVGKIARTVGGITGKGARAVAKLYRNSR